MIRHIDEKNVSRTGGSPPDNVCEMNFFGMDEPRIHTWYSARTWDDKTYKLCISSEVLKGSGGIYLG